MSPNGLLNLDLVCAVLTDVELVLDLAHCPHRDHQGSMLSGFDLASRALPMPCGANPGFSCRAPQQYCNCNHCWLHNSIAIATAIG
jgi:hypothetical protein